MLGIVVGVFFTHLYCGKPLSQSRNPRTGERTITFRDDQVVTIITIEQHLKNLRNLHDFYSQIVEMYHNGEEPSGKVFLLDCSVGQGVKTFDGTDIEAIEKEIVNIELLIQKGEEQLDKSRHRRGQSSRDEPVDPFQLSDDNEKGVATITEREYETGEEENHDDNEEEETIN